MGLANAPPQRLAHWGLPWGWAATVEGFHGARQAWGPIPPVAVLGDPQTDVTRRPLPPAGGGAG